MGAPASTQPAPAGRVLGALTAFDAFPKVSDDFFHRTTSGGIITVVAYAFMLLLFLTETRLWLEVRTTHELVVDSSRGETIRIDFDVEFPRMPCAWLSLDAMDVSGELHLDVAHDIMKQRLSASGAPVSDAERHSIGGGGAAPKQPAAAGGGGNGTVAAAKCGTCYGAEDSEHPCCNTCAEVRAAYERKGWTALRLSDVAQCAEDDYHAAIKAQEGEGCRMWGRLEVNKVAARAGNPKSSVQWLWLWGVGNFHFAAGRSYQQGTVHIHDLAPFTGKALDFAHRIRRLSFGPGYPGNINPLDGAESSAVLAAAAGSGSGSSSSGGASRSGAAGARDGAHAGGAAAAGGGGGVAKAPVGMFQYFLKVVPTVYVDRANATIASNQYSVTEHFRESVVARGGAAGAASARTLPGVFVFYDLSPVRVVISESRPSFLHYLTNLCAIVGGVFAVSGLLDGAVHQGQCALRKARMGKLM
ncbi:hypothetical protein Rsub_03941 [Raphidocelis subcapitata]|uniref:Uncharacterized protein n=1 Tax=Raphidocelis subcapitata TaxID=307507 RepID=A0A2V0P353_9CHLO|nr:hypothetical protein Rsub_03941 [Raphidocelis subcapitata]|eukprot:GBF91637.1 hypothetical protein Rsub_03941 [Raphidocelis subcapitata]